MKEKEWKLPIEGTWKAAGSAGAPDVLVETTDEGTLFVNETNTETVFHYTGKTAGGLWLSKNCCITCKGNTDNNAAGYLTVNGVEASINGETVIPVALGSRLSLEVHVNASSTLLISEIKAAAVDDNYDLCDHLSSDADVLVVTPTYPSYKNLYLSAFAHSRNKAYRDRGLNIQVASLDDSNTRMAYVIDGIPVYRGRKEDLKKLLQKRQYRTLVVHFVDERVFSILDGYLTDEKAVFICHGPETLFEVLPNKVRPYFTPPLPEVIENNVQKRYVKKYSKDDRIEWVFVSEWLKEESEKILDISFKNVHVIGNFINEEVFPYVEKRPEDRKKILIIRKYDNICQHSIDQVVLAIRELARRPFFNDLEFSFYGDGNYYNELLTPIKDYPNIRFYKTFLPQKQIAEVHRQHGILLLPSRHDAHAVSMSEGASSGLVVIGSSVTSNPYFMDDEHNHTMVDPEDPIALADVIERLYYDPDEFMAISKRLSDFVHHVSSKEATIEREVSLIRQCRSLAGAANKSYGRSEGNTPILSIVVCGRAGSFQLERCLFSLINHENAADTEVLVACDASASGVCSAFEDKSKGLVRGIDAAGCTINDAVALCIKEARGEYLKIVYADDWLDSERLGELTGLISRQAADAVLTECSYEVSQKAELVPCAKYDALRSGSKYVYEDLLLPNYGFRDAGPLIYNVAVKTELLKKHGFELEDDPYQTNINVYNYFSKYVDNLYFCDLDLYRIHCDKVIAMPAVVDRNTQNLKQKLLIKTKRVIKAATPYGIIWYRQNRKK